MRDKLLSLHFDGFLIDKTNKESFNGDAYLKKSLLNKNSYEIGIKSVNANAYASYRQLSHLDLAVAAALTNHQFTVKYLRRDFYNEANSGGSESGESGGPVDSTILVSQPAPSEIIRIDNTQRVMYKIDSPLTGVTTETIQLSFKTTQSDGVVLYINNKQIVTYFELVNGLPVVVVDGRHKSFNLKPNTPLLNDNRWHEVKIHRDGERISINMDGLYHDSVVLDQSFYQILTGGDVWLGIADPNNINLANKKPFNGEMVRAKVTINNVQQKVEQRQQYWSSGTAILSSNNTINLGLNPQNIQYSKDGTGTLQIIIKIVGGNVVTGATETVDSDTHYIYLDNLPNTRYISVGHSDAEIDFRVASHRLDQFLIKFQTRQQCGQLVTLINDRNNFLGLELFDGFIYSTSSVGGKSERFQISRMRVDDGRIYQVNMKQERDRLLCWLDADDSYRQSILYLTDSPVTVNKVRIAGQDGADFGFASPFGFVGCIGAVILNDRDVIDYKFVSNERQKKCQAVIEPPFTYAPSTTTPTAVTSPVRPPSLGYISFSGTRDVLVYNFFYDHEKPLFEDISFIFRTVTPQGILFTAHNDDNHNPILIGGYLKDGKVHVVYLNSLSPPQDIHFDHIRVDDGSLYRLNIRRNPNGQGFIQLQSYESVKALELHTQPGKIKFTKILVGGTDEWSRYRFFGTQRDFIGCIIDLFQINGNSIIRPEEISKERYNCQIDMPKRVTTTTTSRPTTRRRNCLPAGYSVSFSSPSDALTGQHETMECKRVQIPFRTLSQRGILFTHSSSDARYFIIVYLQRGYVNLIVKDSKGAEGKLEISSKKVDDGQLHKLDMSCDSGYLNVLIDQDPQISRIKLDASAYFNTYTIGYFNTDLLSSKFLTLSHFSGCIEQVMLNTNECLITEIDRTRLSCAVAPVPQTKPPKKSSCVSNCAGNSCVLELKKNSHVLFDAEEAGAIEPAEDEPSSIRLKFKVSNTVSNEHELVTISSNSNNAMRVYLSGGKLIVQVNNEQASKFATSCTDGKWHQLVLEKLNDQVKHL